MGATVVAIASGKGGVGKTTSAVALASTLADAGHDVVVVDADLGMANLADLLALEPDGTTLHDVLAGDGTVAEATYRTDSGFAIVPGTSGLEGFASADPAELASVVDALRADFDFVLLDAGAGLSHDSVLPLGLADAVLVVTTFEPASVGNVTKTVDLTERIGGTVAGVIATRWDGPVEPPVEELGSEIGAPILAVLPEDEAVSESVRKSRPVTETAPNSRVSSVYRRLAGIVDGSAPEPTPILPETGATETVDSEGEEGEDDPLEDDAESVSADGPDDAVAEPDGAVNGEDGEERTAGGDENAGEDGDVGEDGDAGEDGDVGEDGDAEEDGAEEEDSSTEDGGDPSEGDEGKEGEGKKKRGLLSRLFG